MVMRSYQIHVVKKAFERIKGSYLLGYVFHITGSRMVLTSSKPAALLKDEASIDEVFFLIDRKDLDEQTACWNSSE